jgi:hypothetical protein
MIVQKRSTGRSLWKHRLAEEDRLQPRITRISTDRKGCSESPSVSDTSTKRQRVDRPTEFTRWRFVLVSGPYSECIRQT